MPFLKVKRDVPPPVSLPSLAELYPPPYSGVMQRFIRPVARMDSGALHRDIEEGNPWSNLKRAAEAMCSPTKQIVLLTTDSHQLDIAVNLVANLAAVNVHHYLVLSATESTCAALRNKLACVWSTMLLPRFKAKLRAAGTNSVRTHWLVRQIYVGRLAAMGFSPMLLDADVRTLASNPHDAPSTRPAQGNLPTATPAVPRASPQVILFANPFTLIDRHLPGFQAYFLGDSSAGWLSINGGTLYLRNAYAPTPPMKTEPMP